MEVLKGSKLTKTSTVILRERYVELAAEATRQEAEIAKLKKALEKVTEEKEKAEARASEIKEHLTKRIREQSATHRAATGRMSWRVNRKKRTIKALQARIRRRPSPMKKLRARKREIVKKAKAQGFEKGFQKRIIVRKQEIYRAGWKEGRMALKQWWVKARKGILYRTNSVDSIARCALLVQRLAKVVSLTPEYISIILLIGQYEAFTFRELKSAFEQIEGEMFYKRILYLRDKGYIQRVGFRDHKTIWALTPLGAEISRRMKVYITRTIKERNTY